MKKTDEHWHTFRRKGKPFYRDGILYQTMECSKCGFCYDEEVHGKW